MKNRSKVFGIIAAMALIGLLFAACENPANGEKKKPKTYTVTFDANGGSAAAVQTVEEGGTIAELPTSTLDGFTLVGWFSDKDVWNDEFTSSTVVNGNITVFAKWAENKYTVSFDTGGGASTIKNVFASEGGKIEKPETPTRNGYIFDAWYKEDLTTLWDFANDTVNADITLHAKWLEAFTVSFDAKNGLNVTAVPVVKDRTITKPADPGRNGYKFMGWYKEDKTAWNFTTDIVTANITLHAEWTIVTYTITYKIDGENYLGDPAEYTIEKETFTLEVPAREFFVFSGWFENVNLSGTKVETIEKGNTGNKTFYAKWTINLDTPVAYEELEDFLIALKESGIDNTAAAPTRIKLAEESTFINSSIIEEGVITWNEINNIIKTAGVFVNLDLSACTTNDNTITTSLSGAIQSNQYIKGLILPSTLESIGNYAFLGCKNLTSVSIGDSVISIGMNAFSECNELTNVTIGNSVETIGNYAFYQCVALSNVIIPDGVVSIGDYAFKGCSNLSNVIIPDNVISIGNSAFASCSMLSNVTIGNNVETIGNSAFNGCSNLSSIIIPDNVISIGNYAFASCSMLSNVTIGNNVETIGDSAFYQCTNLSSIIIPDTVISIVDYAFDSCNLLESVRFEGNDVLIGEYVFPGYGAGNFGSDTLKNLYGTGGAGTYTRTVNQDNWAKVE